MSEEKRAVAATEKTKVEVVLDRKAYREKRESALQELDSRLDELKKKTLEMTSGTREDLDEAIHRLGEKRRRFVTKLADLRGASGDAWKDLRKGVDNSWDELEDAFGDLRKGVSSAIGRFKEGAKS